MNNTNKFNSLNIITLGCPKNIVDSEKIAGTLKKYGINVFLEDSSQFHDVILVNTCGFINDAKEESIDTILQCIKAKEEGKVKKIIVFGCLAERYMKELKEELTEVDEFYGVYDFQKIIKTITGYNNDIIDNQKHRILSTPSHYAYLKIADGCNRRCSFCAIPMFKGKYHSFSLNDLIEESKKLVDIGVKELIIVAQDITEYGKDLKKSYGIVDLVDKLSRIDGLEWIRLHYLYPTTTFPYELIDLMKERKNICKYIDIPLQHVSNRILSMMKRGHGKNDIINLINNIRNKLPEITIRSSFIVGFPNEADEDFEELYDFIQDYKLDRIGVFMYSEEEGTYAQKHYKDNIKNEIKSARADKLMKLQATISLQKNNEKIGKILRVIVDYFDGKYFIGRTEGDSPEIDNEVLIKKDMKKCHIGNFYTVKITNATEYDLFGEIV